MPFHPIQTSFNAGEWSPRLKGRVDLEKYRYACETLENWILWIHGAAETVPGTKFIAEVKDNARAVRLMPFIYSESDAYMLEHGLNYMRVFRNQAVVLNGAGTAPYEISTPYSAAQTKSIQWRQSGDVLFIACPGVPPYKLSRTGHNVWTIEQISFTDGPYLAENTNTGIHLRASAVTGTGVTITSENLSSYEQIGTWDDTPAASAAMFTSALPVGGFQFTMAERGKLHAAKIEIDTAATTAFPLIPVLTRAKLYSDVAGAPSVLLATSNDVDIQAAGEKTYTFTGYNALANTTTYWMIFETDTPDDLVTVKAVNNNASYGSGSGINIAAISDSLAYDWMVEVEYQPSSDVAVFNAQHIGSIWRMRHSGQKNRTIFAWADQLSAELKLRGKLTVDATANTDWAGRVVLQKSFDQVNWYDVASFTTSTRQDFFEPLLGVWYRAKCTDRDDGTLNIILEQMEHWGYFEVTAYINTHTVTATIVHALGSTDPSPFWREGAWSDYRGYPRAIELADQRLHFAGTSHRPTWEWASWVGDWENFTPHTTDDAPIEHDISEVQNAIQWLRNHTYLMIGTLGEECRVTGQGDKPMAQDSFKATLQGTTGSAINIPPIRIASSIIHVQTAKTKLMETHYSFDEDAFTTQDLSLFSEHITAVGIKGIVYQQRPNPTVWGWLSDGTAFAKTWYRKGEDEVLGFSRIVMDGEIEAMGVIPSSFTADQSYDEVWMQVKRTINGQTKRFIEVLQNNTTATVLKDFWCVHCGLDYDGAATDTFSGLDHLEGEEVAVLADGMVHPNCTVSGGSITLEYAASRVIVGLPYTCTLKPMPLEGGVPDGTAQGRMKKIQSLSLRLLKSMGGSYGPSTDKLIPIHYWKAGQMIAGQAEPLFTGDTQEVTWHGPSDKMGQVMIVQDQPLPMTVLAIMMNVEVEG